MLLNLIEKIASALDQEGIDYMIIGGQAVLFFGEPRLTKDIDITLGIGPDQLPLITGLLERLDLQILPANLEEFVKKTLVIPARDLKTNLRVNFILSDSIYEKEAMRRAIKKQVGKVSVKFISPEDLIIHKLIAGRPRDIEDIKGIMLKNRNMDHEYIKHWLSQFDTSLTTDFLATFLTLVKQV